MAGLTDRLATPRRLDGAAVTVAVAAALAWAAVVIASRSMGSGAPGGSMAAMGGASHGGAGARDAALLAGVWATMTVAMMLPSALPVVLLHRKAVRSRVESALFVCGYLLVWTLLGALAWGIGALLRGRMLGMDDMQPLGRAAAALVLGGVAVYQFSPLKSRCLSRCRSPLAFVVSHWKQGPVGALRMGAEHGVWCAGCCIALIAGLLALGLMSLTWMVVVALVIAVEKVAPLGELASRTAALAAGSLAIGVALSPGLFAWLT